MARLIENKKIYQIGPYPCNSNGTRLPGLLEVEHRVIKFKRYLPAGVLPDGGVRNVDLVQFYTDPGGLRTVNASDIVVP